jgi:transcriptional regulator with XRE-family HTH domain
MTIGKRLKKWRKINHLTQRKIHEDTGISLGSLSHYEKDRAYMNTHTLLLLYKTYHIDINWLLTGEKNK